ncbi:MAG: glycosyltransferase family 39 protein [Rhodospirillaceae bacterium]|nr:glycosyltransferase family 39 protein [Rhodospirillaceae bacterium]
MADIGLSSLPSAERAPARTIVSGSVLTVLAVVGAVTLARIAVLAGSQLPLSMDEAQYWLWSRDLAFGYFSKPPLLAWIIAATTAVCGDGEACVRVSAPLLHGGTALMIYAIGLRLFDAPTALWSAVTYIVMPGVSVSAVIASTDVPLLFFWTVALHALVRARETNATRWWLLLGIALGLGLLSKYAMAYFALCVAMWVWMEPQVRPVVMSRGMVLAAAVAVALYLPNLVWNVGHDFVSYRHTVDNMNLGADLFRPDETLAFVAAQFGLFGPIMMVALLAAGIGFARRATPLPHGAFLLAFTVPILAVIVVQSFVSRAHANWAAPAYIAATLLACAWCVARGRQSWVRFSIGLHVLAATLAYNLDTLSAVTGVPLKRAVDPAVQVRGWDHAGAWAADLRRRHPGVKFLFDERTTMAEVMYYDRPHAFDAVMWNAKGTVNNHFEMTTDAGRHLGDNFIYVTRRGDPAVVGARFASIAPLAEASWQAYPGHRLVLRAYLARGFQGYAPLDAMQPEVRP